MFRLKPAICTMLVIAALISAISVEAATYYVAASDGSDSNTCIQAQNVSTAKRTIAAGIMCMVGGDTLFVRAGTYANGTITNPPAGTASQYTVVRNYPGERPRITGGGTVRGLYLGQGSANHHIEIRGFEFDTVYDNKFEDAVGTINDTFVHHINFIDNIVHDTTATGLLIGSGEDGVTGGDHYIANNEFYNIGIGTPNYVPGMNTIYGMGSRTIIENNTLHDCANGIAVWPVRHYDVVIRNNHLYRMHRHDLHSWMVGSGNSASIAVTIVGGRHKIYNNIIHDSLQPGVSVYCSSCPDPVDIKIYNNTIYNVMGGHAGVLIGNAQQVVVRNNIVYQTGGISGSATTSNNLITNPSFVNAANADFHLQSGSAAINAGMTLPDVTHDFGGVPRPQGTGYDIGAYEQQQGDIAPAPPANLRAQ